MKQNHAGRNRLRTAAAICAVIAVAGTAAGGFALRSRADNQPEKADSTAQTGTAKQDPDTISAGGTVSCEQHSDSLGLIDTSIRLTVEAVLAESGDSITAGTPLYQITEDSLAKAEKSLQSELQSAENTLIQKRVSCQQEQNSADALYASELLLGQTAQQDYDTALADLDSSLQQAYSDYTNALDTIGNTPSLIAEKQAAQNTQQANADALQAKADAAAQALHDAKSAYGAAAEEYNSTAAEYNAAASVVRYLGKALGMDISGIRNAETVSAAAEQSEDAAVPEKSDGPAALSEFSPDDGSFTVPMMNKAASRPDSTDETESADSEDAVAALYADAFAEYEAQKQKLADAEAAYRDAECKYTACETALTEYQTALNEAQSSISALEKEISTLNSTLSKAKSSLSRLRSEYNSRKASYDTDKLSLQHTLDTDTAAYQNAEYHHEITSATIEDELAEAQAAYDTAEENLRIFEETLADGYVYAQQNGILYSLSTQAGRSISLNTPYAYYVDESSYYTVVELGQNDVTAVSIGDTVLIYASESGITNGKITAISAGESTSLADVRFNVTVTANGNTNLCSGESVNVYFNAGNLNSSDFRDYEGGSESGGSSERTRPESGGMPDFSGNMPDFSGGMPEGFDPSNLPGFGSRKDD